MRSVKYRSFRSKLQTYRNVYGLLFQEPERNSEGLCYDVRSFEGRLVIHIVFKDDGTTEVYDRSVLTKNSRRYTISYPEREPEINLMLFKATLHGYVQRSKEDLILYNDRVKRGSK